MGLERVQRRAVVNAVMNTSVPRRSGLSDYDALKKDYAVRPVQEMCVPSLLGKLEMSLRLFIARHTGHMTRPQT